MKKFICIFICLCIAIGGVACGGNKDELTEKDIEDAIEELDKKETESNKEKESADKKKYKAKDEILQADVYSGLIQVGDKLVQLPITLEELLKLGFDYEDTSHEKSYLYKKDDYISLKILYKGNEVFTVKTTSTSDEFKTVEDLNPTFDAASSKLIEDLNITVFLPGGIKLGDQYTELENKYGEPTKIISTMVYEYGCVMDAVQLVEYGMRFVNDRNTHEITSVEWGKNIESKTWDKWGTVTVEGIKSIQSEDKYNLTLKYDTNYVKGGAISNPQLDTVVDYKNEKYIIRQTINFCKTKYLSDFIDGKKIFEETDANGIRKIILDKGNYYSYMCINDDYYLEGNIYFDKLASDTTISQEFKDEFYKVILDMVKTIKTE